MSKNAMKRGNVTMFGKHVEAAEATILFVKYHSSGSIFVKDPRDRSATFEVILEVRTQDGQPFRTEIQQFFEREPHVGDVVRVQYDPKSKQVKVVTKGDAPFTVELDAWLDLRTHPIAPGSTVQVRYDPQNFFDIIIL